MKVSTESAPDSQIVITIEIEQPELDRSLHQAYQRLAQRSNVPGFRRGKAPRSVIERYYGKTALMENALEQLAPKAAQDAITEHQIPAISQPRIEVTQVDPVIVKATVDVEPEVDLGDYASIRVEPEPAVVEDGAVEEGLNRLRDSEGTWAPVERPAQVNDRVTIDAVAMVGESKQFDRQGFDYLILEGRRDPVPGFSEQIVGLEPGASKEFELIFPEDHDDAEFAGKVYQISVTVSEIKGKQLPELDDEFAKGLGQNFETMADLRAKLEENLKLQSERAAAEKTRNAVLDKFVEGAKLDPPYGMIDEEIHTMLNDRQQSLQRSGISWQDYLRITNQTIDSLHEQLKPEARERVRRRLLLSQLADAESVVVSDDEVNDEIAETIRSSGSAALQVTRLLDQPQARQTVAGNLRIRKAMAWLVEKATDGRLSYPVSEAEDSEDESEEDEE